MKDAFVTVDGLRIHYLEWGTGGKQPLVLLHGIARVAHNFDHLAPHFAEDYRVIAVDMRGHGDSGWHPDGAYLVEDYASDIEGLIEQLGLRDVVLWGNSTGGRVAQVVAGLHPDLVSAVIVEDVGPERPAAISSRRAGRMAVEENGWTSADELFTKTKSAHPRTSDAVLRSFIEHAARRRDDGRTVWKRDPAILKGFVATELWGAVRRIKAPIVYILGGLSTIVPPETQARLKQELPQTRLSRCRDWVTTRATRSRTSFSRSWIGFWRRLDSINAPYASYTSLPVSFSSSSHAVDPICAFQRR